MQSHLLIFASVVAFANGHLMMLFIIENNFEVKILHCSPYVFLIIFYGFWSDLKYRSTMNNFCVRVWDTYPAFFYLELFSFPKPFDKWTIFTSRKLEFFKKRNPTKDSYMFLVGVGSQPKKMYLYIYKHIYINFKYN